MKPTECDACRSAELLARDEVVSEELDYVRAHVRVRRTVRAVCLCGNCGARVTPPAPPMPFDRASCTMEMMAWLCFAKCGLFLPLDRLRRDFADQGAQIASSTMTRWWQRGADLLLPVAESVRLSLLTGSHIQTDGTGLRVVFPRQKASPVKGPDREGEVDETGYLQHRPPENGQILFFGDDKHAVYHFTPDKCGEHLETFLTLGVDEAGNAMLWTGTITADAASNHDRLFLDGDRIESGCNAHSFRKFRDDADKAPLLASRAMAFIDGFYKVEAEAREENLAGAELLACAERGPAPKPRPSRTGSTRTSPICCRATPSARPCSTASTTGRRSRGFSRTPPCPWTTTPASAPCARSPCCGTTPCTPRARTGPSACARC